MQVVQRRPKGKARMETGPPAHRSSGIGGLVKRPELRFAERNRVREPKTRQSDWVFDRPRSRSSRGSWSRFCGRGSVQIRNDVRFDRGAIEEALFEFRRSIDIAELIGARCGLRGVRVGEASNAGPPFAPPNPAFCPDDVLASLEADLTWIDSSDDEPLARGATGRIVSRRVGSMESASRSVCPVVDMAVEDSDGVEGTPRSVQDMSPEMSVLGNRFAALACKRNATCGCCSGHPTSPSAIGHLG